MKKSLNNLKALSKRILSIISLTNAICEHECLHFKVFSAHTFNTHSTNTYFCLLWTRHWAGHYSFQLSLSWREFLKSKDFQAVRGENSHLNTRNKEMNLESLLPSVKYFSCDFCLYTHLWENTQKSHLKLYNQAHWHLPASEWQNLYHALPLHFNILLISFSTYIYSRICF